MTDLPQLRMKHRLLVVPSPRTIPLGAAIREGVAGDASDLATILNVCFDPSWDSERVRLELLEASDVPLTFVAELDGAVVGSASFQRKQDPDPSAGWLHYVGVHPIARGLGLGEILSAAVLAEAVSRGCSSAFLTTDDFRVPAIRTYLKLGFEPDCWHESHEGRWNAIREKLEIEQSS